MNIRLIEQLAALRPYREGWDRLVEQSPTNTVFQTFEWLGSWWDVFGDQYRLLVLLGFEGDTLVAAAPLVLSEKRMFSRQMRCLEFAAGMRADYADFLYRDREGLRGLVRALRTELAWDVLNFDRIPSESPTLGVLAEEFPGWRGTRFLDDVGPTYLFGPGQDGSEVLGKKNARRLLTRFAKAGTVAVRHLTQADLIAPELDAFFDQHVARRALTEAPSLFLDPRYRTFYRRLTERLAPPGWLLFSAVTLDDQPVAFHYGFVYGRRLLWYKPSFSVSHGRFSPGEVLILELFKYGQAQGLAEFDFGMGAEPYKERFANATRQNMKFQAFRSGAFQQLGHADRALREGAKRLRLARQLYAGWRRVLDRLGPGASPG
ncbi:MAG TPA: GNAT family N-acetyltransferase [Candidatus Binatia bacterium]|nr:GNAT family N-acetyltransferase [Candidatus Binatia bacterium]